jgi:hypothetical protein
MGRLRQPTARVLLAVAAAFALLVGLRIHGYSISAWRWQIDGSPASEVWVGAPRGIRSDDWGIQIPLILAQSLHTPRFPSENRLIGLGQSAWVPLEMPVAHPLIFFRPTQWGYFLGNDFGLSWMWWSRVLGLFAVWLGVFRVVTRGRLGLSAAGSALIVFAPFFQFWSFDGAPFAASAGASFLATVALARAQRPARIWASAAALAACGAWFVLTVYPPYQVTLGWLYLALIAGFWLDSRGASELRHLRASHAIAASGAVAFVAAVTAAFVWEARDAIEVMRHTVYPTGRVATGGDRPLWMLANASLAAGLWARSWGPMLNICEAASFWILAPVPLALWAWRRLVDGERIDRFALPLIVYQAVFLAYAAFGVPEWLARASTLSWAPGRRAVIGIGLADALLLVRFLAIARPAESRERRRALALAGAWALALSACAVALSRALPDAKLAVLAAVVALNGILAWTALTARRRALPALALAVCSFATTAWFNPVVQGGSEYLARNPLSQRILQIDRATPGGSTWIAFGSFQLGNLFRAVGVRSVNGTLPMPQLDLWSRIDPEGNARQVYNRYAHVTVVATRGARPEFEFGSDDNFTLLIDPGAATLRDLGVTHVLFHGNPPARQAFERLGGLEHVDSVGASHLYRVLPPPP